MKIAMPIVIVLVLVSGALYGQATVPPLPDQEQPEVLTRGPVHEAFAEPVNLKVQAGLLAPIQPPPDINETPPAQSPQGGQYVWVPGYWSWDAERNNYIWVSACWRVAPPSMYWVPGYWARVADGWEWVAGFWTPTGNQEIEYLPAPPALQDVQPSGPPPTPDSIWVPACWYWNQNQYVLRSGYWLVAQSDWVWAPSHYVWTPRGYVFVAGCWDYTLERRGVLFAPVYFPRGFHGRVGYSYTPSIVIDIGALQISLFTYPRYCHYYFGDYYDDAYIHIGIFPWIDCERHHSWYDPIYQHDRWHYRKAEPRWEERERHDYDVRRADKDLRPARTYHEMEARVAKLPEAQRRNVRTAQPLTEFAADKKSPVKFERSNAKSQRTIVTETTAVRKFGEDRNRWESPVTTGTKAGQPAEGRKGSGTPPAEHKDSTITTADRKVVVTAPVERKEPTATTQDRKVVVTAPAEHKGPTATTQERKVVVTQPAERRDSTTTTNQDRKVVVTQPAERKEPTTVTQERKAPVTVPAERKDKVTQPVEVKDTIVPPRDVPITRPERVKVPTPPIVGKENSAQKAPPPRPDNEHKDRGQVNDTPNRDDGKDASKGDDRQRRNR
jgi:hypothetical protein